MEEQIQGSSAPAEDHFCKISPLSECSMDSMLHEAKPVSEYSPYETAELTRPNPKVIKRDHNPYGGAAMPQKKPENKFMYKLRSEKDLDRDLMEEYSKRGSSIFLPSQPSKRQSNRSKQNNSVEDKPLSIRKKQAKNLTYLNLTMRQPAVTLKDSQNINNYKKSIKSNISVLNDHMILNQSMEAPVTKSDNSTAMLLMNSSTGVTSTPASGPRRQKRSVQSAFNYNSSGTFNCSQQHLMSATTGSYMNQDMAVLNSKVSHLENRITRATTLLTTLSKQILL